MSEVELADVKFLEDDPVIVVQFNCQQINCVRDKFGNVVDGAQNRRLISAFPSRSEVCDGFAHVGFACVGGLCWGFWMHHLWCKMRCFITVVV